MTSAQRGSLRDTSRTPALGVTADLTVTLGEDSAHLTGSGSELVLTAANPLAFWSAISTAELPAGVGSVSGPRALGRAADLMSDIGITFRLVGPRGELVRLGAEGNSKLLRAVTGSNSIELGQLHALSPLLRGWLGQTISRRWRIGVAAALGAAVLVFVGRRARR